MSIRRISEGGSSWHLNPGDRIGLPPDGGVDDPRMESTACARLSYFDHPCDVRSGSCLRSWSSTITNARFLRAAAVAPSFGERRRRLHHARHATVDLMPAVYANVGA